VRPLRLDSWGRVWTLTAWSETSAAFHDFRVDQIETAAPLPELFVDEAGKRLSDRPPRA
jgi:predicted DNA-binding transcriptional regulator YafY